MHAIRLTRARSARSSQVFSRPSLSLRARRVGDVSQEQALEAAAAAGGKTDAAAAPAASAADWALASAAEVSAAVRAKALRPADVDALDKPALRTALTALGLPTSGKLADLRDRLRAGLEADAKR